MKERIQRITMMFMLIISSTLYSQQDAQYSQYMYNPSIFNPAYAGVRDVLSINGIYRAQWLGLEGAPNTQTLSIHSPVGRHLGIGLNVVQDQIGPTSETSISTDISYTLQMSDNSYFSFGIKGGIYSLNVDFNKLLIYNPTDAGIQENINIFSPIIGVGGFYYSDKFYIGISTPNFLKTDHYTNSRVTKTTQELHVYTTAGYVFDINPELKFKPATLVKIVKGAPLSIDLSASFLLKDKFTFGASYRLDSAISALVGFQVSDQLMLGYAYDCETTEVQRYTSGSHEFFIRFEFITRIKGKVASKFF